MVDKFNIRVYGILLNKDKILVSHENIDGFQMSKLPGGGLELGEGPLAAVVREFREELDIDVQVIKLIHTTENFIQSAFRKNEQIVAIHYLVSSKDEIMQFSNQQKTGVGRLNNLQFEWIEVNEKLIDVMTFDMDKQALKSLLNK